MLRDVSDQVPANVHCPRSRLSHKDGCVQPLHGLCTKLHALSFQGTLIHHFLGQDRFQDNFKFQISGSTDDNGEHAERDGICEDPDRWSRYRGDGGGSIMQCEVLTQVLGTNGI